MGLLSNQTGPNEISESAAVPRALMGQRDNGLALGKVPPR
jgi:hypothetical protein